VPKTLFARLVPHIGRLGRGTRWRRTKGRPRVFAHRGDCANAPENTMLAFERGVKVGADGIELDVRFDGDKNVVVFHDNSLERLIGRPGTMDTLPATERAKLRVGGEPVPLFEEVLATFDVEYDVELKTKPGRGGELVAAVAKIIQSSGRANQCLVSSFDPFALLQFHRRNPDIALGYLFHDEQPLPLRRGWVGQWIGASMVHPQHTLCTEDTVRTWHAAGFPINVWTVDDAAELKRLALLGVDSICSNDPGHALSVLGELA
jgi:glycerophosphoryl diester phosphodiesterase